MAGADSLKSYKLLGKIAGVVIADIRCDLLDLQIGVAEQGSSLAGAFLVYKINKGHTHILVKECGQVVGIDGQRLCGVLHSKIVCQMLLDISHSQIGKRPQIGIRVFLYQSAVSPYDIVKELRQLRNVF